jgi:hypothetical protein
MKTDRQLTLSFSVLLALQLATALAAITLFGRMTPAIERIIEDNVVSVDAVETMLDAVLAIQLGEDAAVARKAFYEGLNVAKSNVTEAAETPVLADINRLAEPALQGDQAAARELAARLRSLGEINREAMRVADDSARRLGIAGAWTMVVLGSGGFVAGLVAMRRLRRRLLLPLQEIATVLRSATTGDRLRRCTPRATPTGDLADTMRLLNVLLDRRLEEQCSSTLRDSIVPPSVDDPLLSRR